MVSVLKLNLEGTVNSADSTLDILNSSSIWIKNMHETT